MSVFGLIICVVTILCFSNYVDGSLIMLFNATIASSWLYHR